MKFLRFFNKRFVSLSLLIVGAVGVWLAAWAFWYEPSSLIIKNYEISVPELKPAFSNFKIVAISDVHGGSNFVDEAKIRKIVALANAEDADLIVLLGDFVAEYSSGELKMPLATIADNLRGLQARNGVYAVIGNHDLGADEKKVSAELERVGIRVLNSEAVKIEKDGQNLVLLGLPEVLKYQTWKKYSDDAKTALAKLNADDNIIALVHNPDAVKLITGRFQISDKLRLVLAGHTHGGQVNFPFIGAPLTGISSSYGQKYRQGLIAEDECQMFVTSGIGTSIFPVRFRVTPEISVLNLNRE